MGAKNCPETPRQKMINVMYLVLTAMLALNVDKQVLDAFDKVDKSFVQTINNINEQNKLSYEVFQSKMQDNQQKYQEDFNKALRVRTSSDSLYNYINHLKETLVKAVDGPEGRIDSIDSKSDLNITPVLMITQKNGEKLKAALEAYRNNILALVDPSNKDLINSINKSLDTSDPKPKGDGNIPTWVTDKFEGYPLIAVITLMSKMQSDLRNTESDVINYLAGKKDATAFKISDLNAMVVPSTSDYILSGNTYEAKIFLGAVDKTVVPDVYIGNSKLTYDPLQNAAIYKITPTTIGKTEFNGRIEYKDPTGALKSYLFKHEYEVAKPSMIVSPTKMNILYAGVPNPISVSVPGVSAKDIQVFYQGSILAPNDTGVLFINPKIGEKPEILVKVKQNENIMEIGKTKFRVKPIPPPIAQIAGRGSGDGILASQLVVSEVTTVQPDFDWPVTFKVNSFIMSYFKGGFNVSFLAEPNNPKLTAQQKSAINNINAGTIVFFEKILVTGPDGRQQRLNDIKLIVK